MSEIVLVLAIARNGVIGKKGAIPWHISDDMKRFKALTLGHTVVMGRKTWDSLPRKPLPGRTNIVITRQADFAAEGAVVAHSLDEALALAGAENPVEIMVIGGADIFAAALPRAGRIHLTEVHATPGGDVVLPGFDSHRWREVSRQPAGPTHSYITLERLDF